MVCWEIWHRSDVLHQTSVVLDTAPRSIARTSLISRELSRRRKVPGTKNRVYTARDGAKPDNTAPNCVGAENRTLCAHVMSQNKKDSQDLSVRA